MKMKIGDRVGVLLGGNAQQVEVLGFGTYQGEEVPDQAAVGDISEMARGAGMRTPKLQLDNGDVVWGCECWWGSEESVKGMIESWRACGAKILEADIKYLRSKYPQAPA